MARLGKKGVKEIKLLDVEKKEVIVSTRSPQPSGRKMESTVTKGGQREYNVTAPLVDGNEGLGYIHGPFTLDDVAQTTKPSLYKRGAVTLMIFSLGMLAPVKF